MAKSVSDTPSPFTIGDRVFHQKFGNGNVSAIEGNKLTIDFGGVDAIDSSAVALLLEWRRQARRFGKKLEFVNLPGNLIALATLYGVEELIQPTQPA